MEPIWIAVIGAIGGLVSGLVVALAKPWGEDWQARRSERRARRVADLDGIGVQIRKAPYDPVLLRTLASSVGDKELIHHIGRMIVAADHGTFSDAQGDAAHRLGELRRKL